MNTIPKKLLILLLPLSTLFLTACLEEALSNLFKITADNAVEVVTGALDAKEGASLAKDKIDALPAGVLVANTTINETVACDTGTVAITGAFETTTATGSNTNLNLDFTGGNCVINTYDISGAIVVNYDKDGSGNKSGTVSGNLTVVKNSLTLGISQFNMAYTRNADNSFTEDFGMDLNIPLMGTLNVNTPTPFAGADRAVSTKPDSGVLVITAGGNTKARLTTIDNTQYNIDADTDGDGTYETPITNPVGGGLIFFW